MRIEVGKGTEKQTEHSRKAIEFAFQRLAQNEQVALYSLAAQATLRMMSENTPHPQDISLQLLGDSSHARDQNVSIYSNLESKYFVTFDRVSGTVKFRHEDIYKVVMAKLAETQKSKQVTGI